MKVPIEVILQDPTQPIPPEPTPEPTPTPTPEPSIVVDPTVPNTGLQTAADVTNGVSVGLVIIASLIFAVAIGALMLYLFHLYNHQKAVIEQHEEKNKEKHNKTNDAAEDQNPFGSNKEQKAESVLTKTIKEHNTKRAKAHKWSKGLFIASGATAVLAFAAFMGSFIFYSMIQPNSSSATSLGDTDSTYVTNNGTITITANLYNNEPVITGIKDTALVTTDATKGYELYLSMSDNSLDNKLYLDGDTTSEYYITPTSGQLNTEQNSTTPLELNTWGINLDGSDNYAALPTIANKLLIKTADTAVTEDPIDIYYSVKVDKSLPYGTYKGEIEYNVEPILIQDLSSITYMQDMTTEICNNTETPSAFLADGTTINADVPTKDLIDNRDGKSYTVSKLADGKCWMRQNLDLQKEDLVAAIDSTNTDNPANGFTLPDSQTSGSESWGEGGETDTNTPHLFDTAGTGETYYDCLRYTYRCEEYGEAIPSEQLGNLYNWYTATAGTGTYSTGSSEWENASGSICPKGWRLVDQIGEHAGWGVKGGEVKDFSELAKVYDIIYNVKETTQYGPAGLMYSHHNNDRLFSTPINLVRSGYYYYGIGNVGYNGYVWSSKAFYSYNVGSYYFDSNIVKPWYNYDKYYGNSVRCVAR